MWYNCATMQSAIFLGLFLTAFQIQIPKNNPNGIWQAETGSKFNFQLSGSDLKVSIIEGSNPRYIKYELNLKNLEEANTYKGNGYILAKFQNGKECRFETEWHIVVVSSDRIIGSASNIIPDPETCQVKETSQVQIDLKRAK